MRNVFNTPKGGMLHRFRIQSGSRLDISRVPIWLRLAFIVLIIWYLFRFQQGSPEQPKRRSAGNNHGVSNSPYAFEPSKDHQMYPLANEVRAIIHAMSKRRYSFPRGSRGDLTTRRVLVISTIGTALENVFPLIYSARTLGEWEDDIAILTHSISPKQREALDCLRASPVVLKYDWDFARRYQHMYDAFEWIMSFTHEKLRIYDIVQYLDLNAQVVGPLVRMEMTDFTSSSPVLLEKRRGGATDLVDGELLTAIQGIDWETFMREFPGAHDPTKAPVGSLWSFAISLSLIDRPALANRAKNIILNYPEILKGKSSREILFLLAFWGKFDTHSFREKSIVESSPPPKRVNDLDQLPPSYVYMDNADMNRIEYKLRQQFIIFLAAGYLKCPSIRFHLKDEDEPKFKMTRANMATVASFGREFIRHAVDPDFQYAYRWMDKPNRISDVNPKSATQPSKRVLVHWASKGFVETAYSVIFQERTVGQWNDDIVLLTDELSEENKQALSCLGVKAIYYSPTDFQRQFPWAKENHWYFKLIPYLHPELRKYDIIQYLDLDVIVMGPLRKRYPVDFDPGTMLLLEENGWDTSIVTREGFRELMTPEEVDALVEEFPGAHEAFNGPNHSHSGCACSISILVSGLDSPQELLARFAKITEKYHKVMKYGDQPLIMLSFWGKWKTKFGDSYRYAPYWGVFDADVTHEVEHRPLRYVHTAGKERPSLKTSPFYPFEVFTKMLASDLLKCPELSKEAEFGR